MNPTAIHDHIAAFQAAIQDAGLGRPDISANDILNRFSCLKCEAEGKRRNRNAWYRYFNGRTPGGAFGCWRCGAIGTWCSKKSLAGKERDEFQSHMESVKLERDKALAETHRRAEASCVVAFNAGNLLSVAKAVRKRHPNAEIILAADNDRWTNGNPGLSRAREAALAIGGKLAIPDFEDVSAEPTDFNDLHRQEGLPAVSVQLSAGAPVQAKESDQEAIARLAEMSAAEYESKRKEEAKKLGWRVGFLDEEVRRLKAEWRADAIKQSGSKEEVKPVIECPALALGQHSPEESKQRPAGNGGGEDFPRITARQAHVYKNYRSEPWLC
jgi:hypothetical protein